MKTIAYHRQPEFNNFATKSLTKRIIHAAVVLLALVALAVIATIVVYFSFNNGTIAKFTI